MRQYLPMTNDEVWRFLDEQRVMSLATLSPSLKPHNTPVWYVVHSGKLYFRAQPYKKKVRNIRKDPWVSCTIEAGDRYTELRGVSIEATARIVDDEGLQTAISQRLQEKYARERNYEEMPARWREVYEEEPRVIVEIEPKRIVSWDNRKWVAQMRPARWIRLRPE